MHSWRSVFRLGLCTAQVSKEQSNRLLITIKILYISPEIKKDLCRLSWNPSKQFNWQQWVASGYSGRLKWTYRNIIWVQWVILSNFVKLSITQSILTRGIRVHRRSNLLIVRAISNSVALNYSEFYNEQYSSISPE